MPLPQLPAPGPPPTGCPWHREAVRGGHTCPCTFAEVVPSARTPFPARSPTQVRSQSPSEPERRQLCCGVPHGSGILRCLCLPGPHGRSRGHPHPPGATAGEERGRHSLGSPPRVRVRPLIAHTALWTRAHYSSPGHPPLLLPTPGRAQVPAPRLPGRAPTGARTEPVCQLPRLLPAQQPVGAPEPVSPSAAGRVGGCCLPPGGSWVSSS